MVSGPEGLTPLNLMTDLKLIALDADDLAIISAHLQDAVLKMGDVAFLPREKRFAAVVNRFDWMHAIENGGAKGKRYARRRAALRFERVLGAQVQGSTSRARARLPSCWRSASSPAMPRRGRLRLNSPAAAPSGSTWSASRRSCAISAPRGRRSPGRSTPRSRPSGSS